MQYPADWQVARGQAACSFFDPERVDIPSAGEFPDAALVVTTALSFDDLLAGTIDTRFSTTELREPVTIAGRRGFRLEQTATGEALVDRGAKTYGYVLRLPRGGGVFLRTSAPSGEALVHRPVVDRAAATLVTFPPVAGADVGLPAPVEVKRLQILAAAERNDYDAVAALADSDAFRFTFGDQSGSPAAFWRAEARRGQDPLRALRVILRLPYTLATGHYVWPFAYDKTIGTLTAHERSLLEPLETTFAGESYLGWRAGFTPDGRWVFFVAGD